MRRVLVTHLDSVVGRRLTKALYHDPDVELVLGLGTGPRPSFLDAYEEKCAYQQLDLAKARHLNEFFQSERYQRARPNAVIHLPFGAVRNGERIPGNVPTLVSETRRLIEECKKRKSIERFVYLSTGFVYRPEPGNGNFVGEDHLLGFDAADDSRVRAWIDADLICQSELNHSRMKLIILRSATIVTESGEFINSPPLETDRVAIGYDPLLSVVADRDVARALLLSLHRSQSGIFNIAGREVFSRTDLRVPTWSATTRALISQAVSRRRRDQALQRYGIVLNTHRAESELGFEPLYRVEVRHTGTARRIDTVRAR